MAKVKIKPIGDRVLVKHIEEKEQVRGGIIIPDSAKEKPQEAEVIALGTGKKDENGKSVPFEVKVGDKVMLSDKPQGEKAPTVLAPFESASDIGKVTKLSDDKTQVQVEVKGKQGLLPMGLLMLSAINKIKPVELFARMISVSCLDGLPPQLP